MSSKGWRRKQLGDLVTFQRGHDLSKSEFIPGNYPIAGSNGIIGYHNTFTTKGPSITLGRSGNLGTPYFYQGDFWAHNTTLYVKEFHNSDPKFVYYLLKTLDFSQFNSGSAVPSLNRNYIHPLEVDVPEDLETQHRIADILSALDEKIELNQQTNATLEAIAQAIFKEWFVGFNFPGATGAMAKSELGMIPKGWRVAVFEDELEAERGLSYKGGGLESGNAMPMHNLNSVYEGGGYKFDGIKYYSGEYREKHIVRPGDLIVTNTEQGHKYLLIGYPAIVPSTFGDVGIYSHHIYRVKPKPNSYLTSDFVYHLLLQPAIREQVVGFANGTTVNMLKVEGLQKPKFVLPSKELVSHFSEITKNIRLLHEKNIEQSITLASLRDTLLPKLMSGEIEI